MVVKVDLLIFQLAIIFLPGIMWAGFDSNYAAKIKPSDSQFFLRAFLFGISTYVVEYLLFSAFGHPFQIADLAGASNSEVVGRDILVEVAWALPIGFVLAIAWLYSARYKLLTRFLQRIGATRKFGDEDVWDYMFNSNSVEVEYIHLRDLENEFVYSGWIGGFSETDRVRELILLDVVSDINGLKLYETPRLYLARDPASIHIEFPYRANDPLTEPPDDETPDPSH